jgi:hypothetical protein
MSDDDRVPDAPPAPPAGPPAAWWPPPRPDTGGTPGPPAPPPGIALGGLALALLGLVALLLGQVEVALYLVLATLYLAAQAADVHPALGRLYAFLGWIPPVLGASLLGSVAFATVRGVTPATAAPHLAVAGVAALGALASLVLLSPRAADACVGGLFHGAPPDHTMRLSATLVLVTFWTGPSLWLVARDVLAGFLADPRRLVGTASLVTGLAGYAALAFAAVGLSVRRGWRESLARLGLARPRATDAIVAAAGLAALLLLNSGSEWFERAFLPGSWARDSAFGTALAATLGPGQVLLLGLSAGVGEEITLRGALQPKLGIVLTSLLFAVLHVQYSWYGILSLLAFGLLLGLLRQRSNTTVAIVVHALYDVLAVATARP